jgi:hypothetical protein
MNVLGGLDSIDEAFDVEIETCRGQSYPGRKGAASDVSTAARKAQVGIGGSSALPPQFLVGFL